MLRRPRRRRTATAPDRATLPLLGPNLLPFPPLPRRLIRPRLIPRALAPLQPLPRETREVNLPLPLPVHKQRRRRRRSTLSPPAAEPARRRHGRRHRAEPGRRHEPRRERRAGRRDDGEAARPRDGYGRVHGRRDGRAAAAEGRGTAAASRGVEVADGAAVAGLAWRGAGGETGRGRGEVGHGAVAGWRDGGEGGAAAAGHGWGGRAVGEGLGHGRGHAAHGDLDGGVRGDGGWATAAAGGGAEEVEGGAGRGVARGRGHVVGGGEGLVLGHHVVLLALGGELALGFVAVALALAVLLVGVLDRDRLTEEVLAVHGGLGGVAALERVEADEAVALGDVVLVADDAGLAQHAAELAEGVVEDLLVDLGVEVVDEELGANVHHLLLVGARLVDADRLAPDADAVEHLGGVLGRRGRVELDEAVALVGLRHAVLRHVHLADGADLGHQLREQVLGEALIDVADVHGGVLVLLPAAG